MDRLHMRTFHRLTHCGLILAAAAIAAWGESAPAPSATRAPKSLNKWLDALSFAESGNRDWIMHKDRDGRFYYGCLQFRERTFRYYVAKYNLADSDETDVMELIYDCAFQKRVAARMIRDDQENWKHWRNSAKRIGLPPGATPAPEPSTTDRTN
jgi:hypothetical protein